MHKASTASEAPPQVPVDKLSGPSSCPVVSPTTAPSDPHASTISKLNPLNYMPSLTQSRASNQRTVLDTARTTSSIPRGDATENWQYPSPQQMFNALLRKGYDDTPEDAMESMVAVHNFLNEGAWDEIIGWEARFSRGLREGWSVCEVGEEEGAKKLENFRWQIGTEPRLLRFMGRPGELTPKAQVLGYMGRLWPAKFAFVDPSDSMIMI